MTSPSELTLDYKPSTGYPHIQKSPYSTDQPDQQTQKLEDFLSRLEEERLKIEAFKRELPLCMQLLNSAMETYKQQLEGYRSSEGAPPPPGRPVLEEFIPMKLNIDCGAETATNPQSEKANWMVSAQLWTAAGDAGKQHQPPIKFDIMSPKLSLDSKQRNGGAFVPFSKEKGKGSLCATPRVMPELALGSPESEMEDKKCSDMEKADQQGKVGGGGGGGSANDTQTSSATVQAHRKARRCWSPDLHRRFVNALQILGGSQVATPKQIRELMKVDGLTNDEVKSHLQKYRLHTRRPIQAPQAVSAGAPQLVVLGGIWVPPEYATSAAAAVGAGPAGIYGAHAGHYCAAPMPHEFYTAAPPLQHLHPPPLHRSAAVVPRQQAYKGGNGSPETDVTSGGERSESIEEGTEEGEGREEEEEETEEEVVVAGGDVALKF